MEANIRIYRLPKGRGTSGNDIARPEPEAKEISVLRPVPGPKDSMSILILPSISVTIVFIASKTRI